MARRQRKLYLKDDPRGDITFEYIYNSHEDGLSENKAMCDMVVFVMNGGSYYVEKQSTEDYMKEYAKRAVLVNNDEIRATDTESFIEDLLKHGHIKISVPLDKL